MSENLNEIMKQSESVTKTKANIDTPTIVMSVETESTEKTGVPSSPKTDDASTFTPTFKMKKKHIYKMSTGLFITAITFAIFIAIPNYPWTKAFIGTFSIISLILSVVVKLKTDEEKCLKVMLLRSFIESFNKKDISIKEVEGLKSLLNSIEL